MPSGLTSSFFFRASACVGAVGVASCSLFLDFDLTGNAADGGGVGDASVDRTGSDANGGGDGDAGDGAARFDAGALYAFECPGNPLYLLCDDFEAHDAPVGGKFTAFQDIGGGGGSAIVKVSDNAAFASFVPFGDRALALKVPLVPIANNPLLVAESLPLAPKKSIIVDMVVRVDRDDAGAGGGGGAFFGERTLLVIRPAATIGAVTATDEVARVIVDQNGAALVANNVDGSTSPRIPFDLNLEDTFHYVRVFVKFDTQNPRLRLAVDKVEKADLRDNLVLTTNPALNTFSVGLSAATFINAPQSSTKITARFDNIAVSNPE